MTDWYRELQMRLSAAGALTPETREQVYTELRAGAPDSEAGRLEVAIRRVEQHALLDAPRAPAKPAIDPNAVSDDVYEQVAFTERASGQERRGVAGWRTGPQSWVTLQVAGGPECSAAGASVGGALETARRRLRRQGYDLGTLPTGLADMIGREPPRQTWWKRLTSPWS
ncbi:MAG: hypothetical protein ACQRW7_11240 [Caulobacterales bacterium]|uniref:hypothetical protein n=1 Tax=Glycocaulis sp. TaxID=1969725 RepID=UPI003F9EC571